MAKSNHGEKHRGREAQAMTKVGPDETPIGEMGSEPTTVPAKKGKETLTDAQRAFLAMNRERLAWSKMTIG